MFAITGLKRIGYAYPSSDTARQLGFGLTGCWYVDSFYTGCAECDVCRVGYSSLASALSGYALTGGSASSDCMTLSPTWESILCDEMPTLDELAVEAARGWSC